MPALWFHKSLAGRQAGPPQSFEPDGRERVERDAESRIDSSTDRAANGSEQADCQSVCAGEYAYRRRSWGRVRKARATCESGNGRRLGRAIPPPFSAPSPVPPLPFFDPAQPGSQTNERCGTPTWSGQAGESGLKAGNGGVPAFTP